MSGLVQTGVKILLVDDHALFREGVARLLGALNSIKIEPVGSYLFPVEKEAVGKTASRAALRAP